MPPRHSSFLILNTLNAVHFLVMFYNYTFIEGIDLHIPPPLEHKFQKAETMYVLLTTEHTGPIAAGNN